jgi:hypothetical protein
MFTNSVVIPYENIVLALAGLLVTIAIGLAIRRFAPKIAPKLSNMIKPMSAIIILYILTVGTYTNLYMFKLMDSWSVILSGMLVSYVGYTIALVVSLIFRRSWKITRTIMIETGIHNGALAILMCKFSLPQPDGDMATVVPAAGLMTNSIPLLIAFIIQCIYRKCKGKSVFDLAIGEKANESKLTKDDTATTFTDLSVANLPTIPPLYISTSCPSLSGPKGSKERISETSGYVTPSTAYIRSWGDISTQSSVLSRASNVEFISTV